MPPPSFFQAEEYWRKAVGKKYPKAELALGKLLYEDKKFEEALTLVRQAAEDGHLPEAEMILGTMLTLGQGCKGSGSEGLKWILEAKKKGFKMPGTKGIQCGLE